MITTTATNNQKVLPSNIEMEQGVLGACLIDPDSIFQVFDQVDPKDFYLEKHSMIFEAMLSLHDRRDPVDYLTLTSELDKRGRLNVIGGAAYIAGLLNSTPTAANARQYAARVRELADKRRLIQVSTEMAGLAFSPESSPEDTRIKIIAELLKLAPNNNDGYQPMSHGMAELIIDIRLRMDEPAEIVGHRTGFIDLDKALGGLKAGLHIWCGVPSMGKTALALCAALGLAQNGTRVGILSAEMGIKQLNYRLLSYLSGFPTMALESGLWSGRRFTDLERHKIEDAAYALSNMPIFISGFVDPTVERVRSRITELKAKEDIQVAIFDYLQLLESTDQRANRAQELDRGSRQLKHCADDLGIPVIALSQLRRGIEHRDSHIPTLADLRDSGGIEQAADVVAGLLNEDYYHLFDDPQSTYKPKGLLGVYVLKDRLGSGAGKAVMLGIHPQTKAPRNVTLASQSTAQSQSDSRD